MSFRCVKRPHNPRPKQPSVDWQGLADHMECRGQIGEHGRRGAGIGGDAFPRQVSSCEIRIVNIYCSSLRREMFYSPLASCLRPPRPTELLATACTGVTTDISCHSPQNSGVRLDFFSSARRGHSTTHLLRKIYDSVCHHGWKAWSSNPYGRLATQVLCRTTKASLHTSS